MSLRDHLQEIYEEHGTLTPDLVVAAARPKTHPLHGYVFDRSKADAAEAWFRHRAHELIQEARIVYEMPEREPLSVRAFQAVRTETGYHYEPSDRVAQDPFLRALVLRDMERDWRQLQLRYGAFEEFVKMVTESIAA